VLGSVDNVVVVYKWLGVDKRVGVPCLSVLEQCEEHQVY
jgi:hypothetical protein